MINRKILFSIVVIAMFTLSAVAVWADEALNDEKINQNFIKDLVMENESTGDYIDRVTPNAFCNCEGLYTYTTGDYSKGIYAYTTGDYSQGVYSHTTSHSSQGVYAYTVGDYSEGVYAYTAGDSSEGVYAYTIGDYSKGFYAYTAGDNSQGVEVYTEGDYSKGVDVYTAGDNSEGVYVLTAGDYSDGVYVYTTGDFSEGVCAYTYGDYSKGVYSRTTGDFSQGVDVYTEGDNSKGVDVYTEGDSSKGVDVYTTGYYSIGVDAYTEGDCSDGVDACTIGDNSEGVYVITSGYYSEGVYARSGGDYSEGIKAISYGDYSDGVYAYAYGANSQGVHAISQNDHAIIANTHKSNGKYGVYTGDSIYIGGKLDVVGYVDPIITECFSADMDVDYEVGDVVTLNKNSAKVEPCTIADDTKVVGVVGPTLDIEDGEISVVIMGYRGARPDQEYSGIQKEQLKQLEARKSALQHKQIENKDSEIIEELTREIGLLKIDIEEEESVTRQVVRVKADASYAPIEIGDLLTTSPTRGHAMKAQPAELGSIVGKAMEPLESGTGMIEIFVTLH